MKFGTRSEEAMRPRLLDAFSGAGGAGMGYHQAGFDVVGIDNRPMPHYPFRHIVGDALEYIRKHGHEYDAIHASPPCQHYTKLRSLHPDHVYPDLVAPTRDALMSTGRPWVIENVPGAPLFSPVMLCGMSFGLRVYRHRLFESSVFLTGMGHLKHMELTATRGWHPEWTGFITVAGGHNTPVSMARKAMDIDWMNRDELSQSIPPAYTRFIGAQLIDNLTHQTRGVA